MTANTEVRSFNFTEAQIAGLIAKQAELNTYIHPEWKAQGFNWLIAIQDEIMEIRGHLGWKWWKKDYKQGVIEQNKAQIKLEVIDLLHFVVSDWIADNAAQYLLETFNANAAVLPIDHCLERFMHFAASDRGDVLGECWTKLAHCVGLTEQEILETYAQKYVLNKFRQDHGYKDGSYVKSWERLASVGVLQDGVSESYVSQLYEDNEVLAEIVKLLKASGANTTDETLLYNELRLAYNSRLNKS